MEKTLSDSTGDTKSRASSGDMESSPGEIPLDRIRGMLIGVALGDALGAPHEFRESKDVEYTGRLVHQTKKYFRFTKEYKYLEVGQVTDDTEMTLALAWSLVEQDGYDSDEVTFAYLKWANSGIWMMGNNTRRIFKGIKTLKGYENRIDKIYSEEDPGRIQANGCLMRAAPLALLGDKRRWKLVKRDTYKSNPNELCAECVRIYVEIVRGALLNWSVAELWEMVQETVTHSQLQKLLQSVKKEERRDIVRNKGWILHAMWLIFVFLKDYSDGRIIEYKYIIDWVIEGHPGSDTDTNAAIVGGIVGALLGYESLQREKRTRTNLKILRKCDVKHGPTPRPSRYTLRNFDQLTVSLHELANKTR